MTPKCPLPRLLHLETLKITDTFLSHPLSKRKFPKLRCLELRGSETVGNCPNIRIPLMSKFTIGNPELLQIKRDNQFYYLRELNVIKPTGDFENIPILNRINDRYFPRLIKLEIECGVLWDDIDFNWLQASSSLEHLVINSRGTINPYRLNDMDFPALRSLTFNSDEVFLDALPPHVQIRSIIVPPHHDLTEIVRRKQQWPNLKTCGYVGDPDFLQLGFQESPKPQIQNDHREDGMIVDEDEKEAPVMGLDDVEHDEVIKPDAIPDRGGENKVDTDHDRLSGDVEEIKDGLETLLDSLGEFVSVSDNKRNLSQGHLLGGDHKKCLRWRYGDDDPSSRSRKRRKCDGTC